MASTAVRRLLLKGKAAILDPTMGWKTTNFWGPMANWGIVAAGVLDMTTQGPDMISIPMTGTLCVYSALFMRFAWMVQPRNYLLLYCHIFNEGVQLIQLGRALKYQRDQKALKDQRNQQIAGMSPALASATTTPIQQQQERMSSSISNGSKAMFAATAAGAAAAKATSDIASKASSSAAEATTTSAAAAENVAKAAAKATPAANTAKAAIKGFHPVLALQSKICALPMPELLRKFLMYPAGPFTIFFWAPAIKWGISAANLVDYKRPVEKVSIPQQLALFATGVIWARWSFVITPVNYNLALVNVCLASTAFYHLMRKLVYDPFPNDDKATTTEGTAAAASVNTTTKATSS